MGYRETRLDELRHPRFIGDRHSEPAGTFRDAPVFIVVCEDPRAVQASALVIHFLLDDGGPFAENLKNMANATQILHLAAAACGLGSQWCSVSCTTEPRLKDLLDVAVELTNHTLVPVGYPASAYRRELKEIVHHEKYDRSKYRSGDDIFNFILNLRKLTSPGYPVFPEQDKQ